MSDLQSKTPITDRHEFNESCNFDVDWPAEMRALELAANGLADELKWRMDQLDVACGGDPCKSEALAAFATLTKQPAEPSK